MTRRSRWTLHILLGLAALVAVLGILAAWLVPSDEELAARITAETEAKLGVKVTLGAVHWQLLPAPSLLIEDAATVQPQPISFKRLVASPRLGALIRGQLLLDDVFIDGGVLPQLSLRGLKLQPAPPKSDTAPAPVERLHFRNLTWMTRYGRPLEFDGDVRFDTGWRPREAVLSRAGASTPVQLDVLREGSDDRWQLKLALGGGTANGHVEIKPGEGGLLQLTGELAPTQVEVDSALDAFKRNSAVRGKANGKTLLSAQGRTVAELSRSLHTRTTFTMRPATLLRLDVDKAIRSAGRDRTGQTVLQSLTGQMDTQNTPEGIVVRYSNLQAKGETFSASGGGTIANRQIDGEVKVDLIGGLVGVPLKITGPLASPHVSVPASAVAGAAAGAAVGTVLLPGIGTAIGASVGATIGRAFGGDKKK